MAPQFYSIVNMQTLGKEPCQRCRMDGGNRKGSGLQPGLCPPDKALPSARLWPAARGGGGAQIRKRRLLNFYRSSDAVEFCGKLSIPIHKKDFVAHCSCSDSCLYSHIACLPPLEMTGGWNGEICGKNVFSKLMGQGKSYRK